MNNKWSMWDGILQIWLEIPRISILFQDRLSYNLHALHGYCPTKTSDHPPRDVGSYAADISESDGNVIT